MVSMMGIVDSKLFNTFKPFTQHLPNPIRAPFLVLMHFEPQKIIGQPL